MRRDLEHRLQALETSWYGSPKIAPQHRARAMELRRAILDAEANQDNLGLERCRAELERIVSGNRPTIKVLTVII